MYVVYSRPNCSYCDQAKSLLQSKKLDYTELIIDVGQPKDSTSEYVTVEMLKSRLPSASTVPQIFRNGEHIGGFDALRQLLLVS